MPDMKNKLMHMIQDVPCDSHLEGEGGSCPDRQYGCCKEPNKLSHCAVEKMAERLIAGGVEIPVRCVRCKYWSENDDGRPDYGLCFRRRFKRGEWVRADGYCDKGVEKENT